MFKSVGVALMAMLAVSAARSDPPTASPAAAPSSSAVGPEIVVHGARARAVENFVRQMTDAQGGGQVARWNDPICPRIINLQPAAAKAIKDRMLDAARVAKAPLAKDDLRDGSSCTPNVLVVFTSQPDDVVRQIHQKYFRLFQFPANNDRPAADYDELLKPRPIRWIVGTDQIGEDGNPLIDGSALGNFGAPVNNDLGGGTSLHLVVKRTTTLVIEIVDATKLNGISTAQLGDYLALVALSQPRLATNFHGSTLLAMFADRDGGEPAPAGLTPQDRRFLGNLYGTDPLHDGDHQRASIAYRMRHVAPADASGSGEARSPAPVPAGAS